MSSISLLNFFVVGIFGMILSVAFCDISWTQRKYLILAGTLAAILAVQGIVSFYMGQSVAERLYPILTHVPLAVVLCVISRNYIWSIISILTAYFCCQIRRWLALLMVAVFSGNEMMQNISELALTVPLLLLLMKFAVPSMRGMSRLDTLTQCQFGLIPLVYYGYDYLTRIYSEILLGGNLAAIEFMSFMCCVVYLIYVFRVSEAEQARRRLEQVQSSLSIQIEEAVREIEILRESQQKTSIYRHDLRHHMQYLLACIQSERIKQAQLYIQEICSEIEANNVTAFCNNEAVNLILSAFAGRARKYGITWEIRAVVPQVLSVAEKDLCVLLSNALENALQACQKLKEKGISGMIETVVYVKKEKFLLQIINSCGSDVVFDGAVPVTDNPGHGIGVRSICEIVEKYHGMYTFQVKDGRFILRVSLPLWEEDLI